MTTDSYVVSPLFFPGGDIGWLAVHGTVNDLAMAGAPAAATWPPASFSKRACRWPTCGASSSRWRRRAREAGVPLVTGDTKVVDRGKGDGVFINTAGIGVVPDGSSTCPATKRGPAIAILVSGTLGDHGMAIMSLREGLEFETTLESDTAALHGLVDGDAGGGAGHCAACAIPRAAGWRRP